MKLVSPYFEFLVQARAWKIFSWEVEELKNFLYAIIFPPNEPHTFINTYLTEERDEGNHLFISPRCVHVQSLSWTLSQIPAVFCFGQYGVYTRSWADLPTEMPWSLKWSEQLIYLCLLLCLYLLTCFDNKNPYYFLKKKIYIYIYFWSSSLFLAQSS